MKLLKALAGNDKVKLQIINNGASPLIESALNRFKSNEVFAKVALGCISTLALRVKENSVALFATGIAETIVQTLKIHEQSKMVQRNGAWAIRNMVARAREQCDTFIGLVSHGKNIKILVFNSKLLVGRGGLAQHSFEKPSQYFTGCQVCS
jgi:armadillo repeat-containing protein 6